MEYAYYPGCSLEYTGKPYDLSIREVFKLLGVGLKEIEDWNCCGATMYMSVDKVTGYAVSARNLALAQEMGCDICAPCSSCYTILRKTNRHLSWNGHTREIVNEALKAAGLKYDKPVEIRHPLDILVNDVGLKNVSEKCVFEFDGLKVAPYYGCQIVRPVHHFDDMEEPMTMDRLLESLGAIAVPYQDKVRCCGGMLMTTFDEVACELNHRLLVSAEESGADVIATTCPLCQMNLEAYQTQINKLYHYDHHMPVVYFSQLVGMALGAKSEQLGLNSMFVPMPELTLKQKAARRAV